MITRDKAAAEVCFLPIQNLICIDFYIFNSEKERIFYTGMKRKISSFLFASVLHV